VPWTSTSSVRRRLTKNVRSLGRATTIQPGSRNLSQNQINRQFTGVAHRQLASAVEHRSSKYLNNRAENPHQPTGQREKAMKGFRSVGATQRFLASFSSISPHFRPGRHRLTAEQYRTEMATRFAVWDQVTDLPAAA